MNKYKITHLGYFITRLLSQGLQNRAKYLMQAYRKLQSNIAKKLFS